MMIQTFFTRTASAGPESARMLRGALEPVLIKLGVERRTIDNFMFAVSEIVVNVALHAVPPAEVVEVRLLRDDDFWVVDLFDDGAPFDGFDQAVVNADLEDLMAEDGRGLGIIASMFPDHAYTARDPEIPGHERNRLRLRAPTGNAAAGRARILLVDDDESFLRLLSLYLGDPYQVTCCTSVAQAIEVLSNSDVDLIISDINMPGKSGLALREELSENAGTDTLPFIFLTGQDDTRTREQASDLSIDDFLVKPVRRDHLQELVARRLRRSKQIRERLGQRLDQAITELLQPDLPASLGTFTTAVRSRSASSGGGDLLLSRPVDDGHLVMLADLMGHGEQAKFFAHAYAGYLYGLIRASGEVGPAAVLANLSDLLADDPVLSRTLATVQVMHLSDDGTITIASAGHPAPIEVGVDGDAMLSVGGMLPGLLPGIEYDELVLAPGRRRLVFYTDGLFEQGASTEERDRNEQTVREALRATVDQPVEEAADSIMAVFDALCIGGPEDDVALMLLDSPG